MKDFFFFLSSCSGRGWRRTLGFALTESQGAFSHLCTRRCSKIAGKLIDGSVQRAHLQTSPDWCAPQSSRSHTTKTIIYLVLFAPWEKKTTPSSLHRSGKRNPAPLSRVHTLIVAESLQLTEIVFIREKKKNQHF